MTYLEHLKTIENLDTIEKSKVLFQQTLESEKLIWFIEILDEIEEMDAHNES